MGLTHVTVRVMALAGKRRGFEAEFLVDTGAIDCLVPEGELKKAGIAVEGRDVYELGKLEKAEYPYGHARVSFMGSSTVSRVIFGPNGAEPILGVVALESTGIAVDPVTKTLKRMSAKPLKAARRRSSSRAVSTGFVVLVAMGMLLHCSPAVAQQPAAEAERSGHGVMLLGGGAMPVAGTLVKGSGALGFGYSQRVHRGIAAELNAMVLYDGRTGGGGNSGEGSFGSAGYLVHAGVQVWRARGKAFADYGGGLVFAHYKTQIGAYRPVCGLCSDRDGWGAYASATVGRKLDKKNGVMPWFGLRVSTDLLAVSGTFGNVNKLERRTTDGWILLSGVLSFTF